jgi:LmbE family N-acetylglucosaminyl deacetylase
LGVDHVECLDLGDGRLAERPASDVVAAVRAVIGHFAPDVVVTFGPDGAFGHPDHVASSLATLEAVRQMDDPPRLLHARFPGRGHLLTDLLVEWLISSPSPFRGGATFAHALKLFADGSATMGFTRDHLDVEWFPAGSYVIEQGEPATALYCILSGSATVVEDGDGGRRERATVGPGCFVGEEGLATGDARSAHVIASEDMTCLVLAPCRSTPSEARGAGSRATTPAVAESGQTAPTGPGCFTVDVTGALDRKVAALVAHRSQYALEPDLFPRPVLERLLGSEHFAVATPRRADPAGTSWGPVPRRRRDLCRR